METTVAVQELTDKVSRLEREVTGLRQEVNRIRSQALSINGTKSHFVDQETLNCLVDRLFADLGVEEVEPIGSEALQKMMAEERLESNELSQSIIAAREE